MLELNAKAMWKMSNMLREFSDQIADEIGCRVELKAICIEGEGERDRDSEAMFVEQVKDVVCKHYDVKELALTSSNRHHPLPEARAMCYRFIKEQHPKMPLKSIGWHFGKRDHSTVINGLQQLEDWMQYDKSVQSNFKTIKNKIV